jgi:hypothetical protein
MPTGARHVAGGLAGPLQHLDPPAPQPRLLHLRHSVSVSQISTNEDAVDAAGPVDAQNAPTRDLETTRQFPQRQQRSSSVRRTQTEESPKCQPCVGISHRPPNVIWVDSTNRRYRTGPSMLRPPTRYRTAAILPARCAAVKCLGRIGLPHTDARLAVDWRCRHKPVFTGFGWTAPIASRGTPAAAASLLSGRAA